MREFESGATRDSDDTKLDYEGFLSPLALRKYAEYLNIHRKQADGKMRASDNWQKGIPTDVYMKSMFRHFMDLWTIHRGHGVKDRKDEHVVTRQEALCAIIFNAFGILHEDILHEDSQKAIKRTFPAIVEATYEEDVRNACVCEKYPDCRKCPNNSPGFCYQLNDTVGENH